MRIDFRRPVSLALGGLLVAGIAAWSTSIAARQAGMADGVIAGNVTSGNGAEAGVWVIAETTELETKFAKVVVTDDDGNFVLPQMPDATYDVWVRGYGLVDSEKVQLSPGQEDVQLAAVIAPTPRDAAQYYPGNYWYSLIEPPAASEFPGTGNSGNGINPNMRTQSHWVDNMKQGCQLCHQLGNTATRVVQQRDEFDSTIAAWDHRVQTGQRGNQMSNTMNRFGREPALQMFAEWTDRIANGALPEAPPRPDGIEQNVVVTLWDWGQDTSFIHDEIATDKRNPQMNGGGPVYGVSAGHGTITFVDPVSNTATELTIPVRPDPETMPTRFPDVQVPSYYWGDQELWGVGAHERSDPHNPMLDHKGRVWMTSTMRQFQNPDWCRDGSDNRYSQYYSVGRAGRHASYYDPSAPADEQFVLVDTCFGTHHLQFGEDEDDTLWFSGDGNVVGWLNTRLYDETGDEQGSQGWCPTVLDTKWRRADHPAVERAAGRESGRRARHPGGGIRLRHHREPDRPRGLDQPDRAVPGVDCPSRSRRQSARDVHRRDVPAAVHRDCRHRPDGDRVRPARHRRRSQRRHLGRALRQQPHGQLRPQQVCGDQRS